MRLTRSSMPVMLIATVAVVACGNENNMSPRSVSFDASQALARVEPIAAILDQPIFASFNGAERFFETFFRSATVASALHTPMVRTGFQLGIVRSLTALGQRLSASTIPADAKGKTFVWDSDTQS